MIKRKHNLKNIFSNLKIVRSLLLWSKSYIPPGFSDVSLYDTLSFIIKEIQKDNLTTRANSISFSFFISIFPAIIFLFTLLPLFPIVKDYTLMLNMQLRGVIPKNAHDYIFSIINDITSIKRDSLLSLGALLALFFSSNGMLTLMSGFDKAYHETFKPRSWINSRLIAIALTVVLSMLLIMSLIMMVLEGHVIDYLRDVHRVPESVIVLFSIFNWLFAIFMVYTGISLIYTYGPSMHRRIPFINVGAIIATIFSLITSLGFSFFINNFGRYNEIYGSIGALIVMMTWIQFNSFILLVGFELIASISVHHIRQKSKAKNQIIQH
ncbi:MAG: YihY/virulence factor BrkB family protein [Saprospiraceae bacterium]